MKIYTKDEVIKELIIKLLPEPRYKLINFEVGKYSQRLVFVDYMDTKEIVELNKKLLIVDLDDHPEIINKLN